MKQIVLIIIFFITGSTLSQVTFEKGYFILTNGEKVECLIKNNNWNNSPETIKYKLLNEDEVKTIEASKLSEFTIYNLIKFKSIDTKIDNSNTKDINLVSQTLFAQIIVESDATLYSYSDNNGLHYFYNVGNSEIKELIQKEYIENGITKFNNDYLVKLNTDLKCTETSDFARIKLNEKELKKYFINYNSCKNSDLNFVKTSKKIILGLNVFAGFNSSSLTLNKIISNQFIDDELNFENKTTPTFGVEGEIYLPINNYKFSIVSGLTYRSYNSKTQSLDGNEKYEIEYTSIEVNLGVRHYMYLNERSKLFIEASVVKDFLLNDKLILEFDPISGIQNGDADNTLSPKPSISFGIGYIYNNIGVKFKYFTSREMYTPKVYDSKFDNISLQLTYKVL